MVFTGKKSRPVFRKISRTGIIPGIDLLFLENFFEKSIQEINSGKSKEKNVFQKDEAILKPDIY